MTVIAAVVLLLALAVTAAVIVAWSLWQVVRLIHWACT